MFAKGGEGGEGESIVQQRTALFEKLAQKSQEDACQTLSRTLTNRSSTHPPAYTFFDDGEKVEGGEEEEGEEGKKIELSDEMKQTLESVFGSIATRLNTPRNQQQEAPQSPSPPPSPSQPSPPSPSSPALPSSSSDISSLKSMMDSPRTEKRKRNFKSARKELSETEFKYCSQLSSVLQQYHHPLSSILPKKFVVVVVVVSLIIIVLYL